MLAVGAGGGGLDIFSLIYHFSLLSPSLLGDGPILTEILSQTYNQPTNGKCPYALSSLPSPISLHFRFSFRFFKKGSCQLLAKVCARSTG